MVLFYNSTIFFMALELCSPGGNNNTAFAANIYIKKPNNSSVITIFIIDSSACVTEI